MSYLALNYAQAKKIAKLEGFTLQFIKEQGPILLKTGAKLFWNERTRRYGIYGYAHDGSDVKSYAS